MCLAPPSAGPRNPSGQRGTLPGGREGLTPLHYAVRSGKLPLIQLLLDHGADVNARDPDGLTPLEHLAKSRAKIDPPTASAIHTLLAPSVAV